MQESICTVLLASCIFIVILLWYRKNEEGKEEHGFLEPINQYHQHLTIIINNIAS